MTTSLIPISDMERMAQAFAKSGMFGPKTPEQCLALLLLAQAEGQHPAIAMRDFDVIQGRPAKKAEAMLRSFLAAGGKVEWHKLDDAGADATFSHQQGGTARISWDAERAKKAGLSGRDMYSKYPRAMYRSRVVSEGCRTVYPAATSGLYVPEEVRAMLKDDKRTEKDMGAAQVVDDPDDAALKALESGPPHAPPSTPNPTQPGGVGEGAGNPADITNDLPWKPSRTDELRDACRVANVLVETVLKRGGVKTAEEMSAEDYKEALRALHKKAKA